MDKLGQNVGRVFNSRSGYVRDIQLCCFETKLPNLMLKTVSKQLLGSLPGSIRDKLQLTGQNLGGVFNSRSGHTRVVYFHTYEAKQPNLKWKSQLRQSLGFSRYISSHW